MSFDFNLIFAIFQIALASAAIVFSEDLSNWIGRRRIPLIFRCHPRRMSGNGLARIWDIEISCRKDLVLVEPIIGYFANDLCRTMRIKRLIPSPIESDSLRGFPRS